MQPPPRKGNYAKFLKNLHAEQVAKLQLKNQNECELLEDIRNFILKRSAIEKSYAEALLKISSAFLNRKIPNIPDLKTEGSEEKWNMWNVWRTVLEENEKLARARLAAVEVFSQHVADEAKILRANKLVNAKRCLDQLVQVQKEVQTSVLEVDKNKKAYFDEEHSAHDVRDKARDIEEKLKKKKGSFFQSITSLQKNSAKVTSKREQLEEKSSGARNDYLLSLAAANAHQTRYFVVDFQNTILSLEACVYDKVAEYLMLIARTELLTCTATQTSFNRIKEQSSQLTREYNLQCVYLYYPVLKQHIQYDFEPCDNDTVTKVTAEHSSSSAALAKEAKRWATRIGRESANIKEAMSKIQTLHALRESGQKTDPNDPNGPDIDTKMDELRQTIRRAETSKAKAEARIECLRAGGVNVDEFMQEIENLSVQDLPRSSSSMSVRTDASGLGDQGGSDSMYDSDYNDAGSESAGPTSLEEKERPDSAEVDGEWAMLEQERQRIEQLTAGWDDPTQVDWGHEGGETTAEISKPPPSDTAVSYKCTALYSYTAQNPDELSIVENEQLEVVGEGDGDGWLRARNYKGEEGYVPHNYLDVEREEPWSAGKEGPQLTSQISFSSVDYTVDEEPSEQSVGQDTIKEAFRPPDLDLSGSGSGDTWCIALYDYEATCPEELSFYEGDIIKILRKVVHDDVDDGWWEGQKGDEIGLFPSLVVEECRENGEPLTPECDDTPPGSAPPVFTPPEVPTFLLAPQAVIITQPTPVVESNPIIESEETEESADAPASPSSNSFSMELTGGQRKHYDKQFGEVEICVTEEDTNDANVEEDDKAPGPDFGLSSCSVVITAATPMLEEAEKPFPPTEEEAEKEPSSEVVEKETTEEVPPPYAQKVKVCFQEDRTRFQKRKIDPYETDSDVIRGPSGVQIGLKMGSNNQGKKKRKRRKKSPLAERSSATESRGASPEQCSSPSSQVSGSGEKEKEEEDQPADSAPFPPSSSTGSEEDTYTGPSTAENSQSDKRKQDIPDELEPHQLARLQDLKESDA